MFEIQLKPRTTADGSVVLGLGLTFRIVFGFLAAIPAVGVVSSGSIGWVPAGALLVMGVGALYEERWILNPHTRVVTARHGLILLSRKRHWSFDQIVGVHYSHYRVGSVPGTSDTESTTMGRMSRGLRRHYLQYFLLTEKGDRIRIEMRKVTDWDTDFNLPQTVAATLSVPLTVY